MHTFLVIIFKVEHHCYSSCSPWLFSSNHHRCSIFLSVFLGDVIVLGNSNVFRFNHPREAAELREKRKVHKNLS